MTQNTSLISRRTFIRTAGVWILTCGLMFFCNADAAPTGRILIAGYGPELPAIQDLAKAYERLHPGTAIDFEWDSTVRAVHLVKTGEAQIAVTDQPDPALDTIQIAWDGIAIIINFSNPVKEVSSAQLSGLLSGQIRNWSALDGPSVAVEVISRSSATNLTPGLQRSLGLMKQPETSSAPIPSDQNVLRLVAGRDATISYISLPVALKAQEDGVSIRILTIDQVDPGEATVRSGRYPLRRPVLMLTRKELNPLTESFLSFVRSVNGQALVRNMFVSADSSVPVPLPSASPQPNYSPSPS